jgi:type IV pilus assembly protein PilM
VLSAGLKTPNFTDRAAVAGALRQALDEISVRETQITVVIPDAAVRVLMLDFDLLPAKGHRSPAHHPLSPAQAGSLRGGRCCGQLSDHAGQVRRPGARDRRRFARPPSWPSMKARCAKPATSPGSCLPSTLAALAAVSAEEPSLVINRNGSSVTTAITRQE